MKTSLTYAVTLLILLGNISCTNTRWMVKDPAAIDYNDYEVIQNKEFLQEVGTISPEDPALTLRLLSYKTYEYAEKVLVQRNIQEYRPRPGLMALGLVGAALSIYAANTDVIAESENSAKKITLNTTGALLAFTGFLSMKPVGEPRNTGEERFLRKTGTSLQTDTVKTSTTEGKQADIIVRYGGEVVREENNRSFNSGILKVDLGSTLNSLNIIGNNPDSVQVEVQFQDSTYRYEYPLEKVLHPFARITSPITALHNAPVEGPSTVLAELIRGGELQIIDDSDAEWYKVLYGISESYIQKSDSELIWRSSEFARGNQVVAVPRIPFGNIDVETNIPIFRSLKQETAALVIANEGYQGELDKRTYAHRDGQLIQTYLEHSLGYPEDHIFSIEDLNNVQQLSMPLSSLDSLASDSTELLIYLSGYGSIDINNGRVELGFIPVTDPDGEDSPAAISLSDFFRRIASIPSGKTVVIADIDFNHPDTKDILDRTNLRLRQPLRRLAEIITSFNPRSAVLFGSELGQQSAAYLSRSGEDKKHRVFPYYFARALQQRNTRLAEIYQYLQRNVSYQARRLHDHPQDPQLFGRVSLDLASD